MRSLLDIGILIALFDENHQRHPDVSDWFSESVQYGWISCPLTQNGCVRILSQAKYPNSIGLSDALSRLRVAASTAYHSFVPDDVSLLDGRLVDAARLTNHGQITDVYLLALAVNHDARFVTLDKRVQSDVVIGARHDSLLSL